MPESLTIEADENEELQEEHTTEPQTKKPHKQWYASVWFWLIIGLTLAIGAGLIWYFVFFAPNQISQQQKEAVEKTTNTDWQEVVQEAEKFTKTAKSADSIDDFDALATNQSGLIDALATAQKRYEQQDLLKIAAYEAALSDISDYADSVKAVLDKKKEDIKETDLTALKDKAAVAKTSVAEFIDEASFIDEDILGEFYIIHVTLKTLFDTYTDKVKADADALKKEQEAVAAKEQAQAADKKAAETAVTAFASAYIDGILDTMKTFMTASFKTEFDYSQREDGYYLPTSYRIIDTVRNSDARYYVYGRMTEKVVGGTDQFSYDWNFTAVKQSGKWLVDLDQAPAR